MTNSISFRGGFLVDKPPMRLWNKIKRETISRNGYITEFKDSKDKFVLLDNIFDDEMSQFILKKKLKFYYYPTIQKKDNGIQYQEKDIKKLLDKERQNAITQRNPIIKRMAADATKNKHSNYEHSPNDYIYKTLEVLKLNKDDCYIVTKKHVTEIYKNRKIDGLSTFNTEKLEKIASCSPNNYEGVNCIYVYPNIYGHETRRLEVDMNGKIIKEYSPDRFDEFYSKFKRYVSIDKKRTANYKF